MKKTSKVISELKSRNERVEADKAWETSKTRRGAIAILTYLTVVIFLFIIGAEKPWMTAIVPTAGFVLSTLALGPLKKWWINNIHRK